MSDRSVAASVVVVLAASVAGCDGCSDGTKQPKTEPSSAASTSADAGRAVSLHRTSREAGAPEVKAGCRLVATEPRGEISRWMSTAPVAVRVLESGREWRIQGDDVLPCALVGNVEVTIVAQGAAENLPGNEGAGAEAWLASPCAALRAAGGSHKVTVKDGVCSLHVSGGTLLGWIAADARAESDGGGAPDAGPPGQWHRLDPRTEHVWRFDPKKPLPAVEACEAAAAAMDGVAAAMAKGALGQAAADAATVRASVRAACTIARARVRLSGSGDAGESPLDKRIDAATARGLGDTWRAPSASERDAGPPR